MNFKQSIFLSLALLLLSSHFTSLSAQKTWEEREEQRQSKQTGFWDWLFSDFDDHIWDESVHVSTNIYDGIVLKVNLSRQWKFSIGDNKKWTSSAYNDDFWETIKVPDPWENDGFHGYDGYAWYRIHFDGTDLNENHTHYLVLGNIDDVDETYLNGNLVGKSGEFPPRYRTAYNHGRRYFIPSDKINFNGDNVIAVRVFDEHQNGGIINGRPGIYATQGNEELLQGLYGQWKFSTQNHDSYKETYYNDSRWETLLVPSHWDNQGYRSLDGIAWYRKHFDICFTPEQGESYYLVMGNIDDFDITYLNGQEIGRTDDGKGYGHSISYKQMRIYKIPPGLLETSKKNLLAVKVYDIGNEGGIYKGPIGIVKSEQMTRLMRQK